MRVLVSSTWGIGHVYPVVPLAQALADAGHDVLWAGHEPACAPVRAAGLEAVPVGLSTAAVAAVQRRLRAETAALAPQDHAAFAYPTMFGAWAAPAMVQDLLPLARAWQPDVLVHETAELGAPLVAAALGVPAVTHAFGQAVPAALQMAAGEVLADLWAEHGLPQPPYAGLFRSGYLDICPPSLQLQSVAHIADRELLRPVAYTGEPTDALRELLADDARPLVYVTLGTVFNDHPVLAVAAQALAALDARVLISVGPGGDPAALGTLPAHVRVEQWVCQSDVIPHCAAVVCHAGSGTFLGSLQHGVPLVCLPQAADQFRNTAAATARGVGVSLLPDEVTPGALVAAVREVLTDPGYGQAAAQVAAEMQGMPSPAECVALLEALAGHARAEAPPLS